MNSESNNGWFPIAAAPKRKGKGGHPHKILVTHAPHVGERPPLNIVWWGKVPHNVNPAGYTWVVASGKPLRYEPTHWREFPEFPTPEVL